jgi:hypothetical protein
MRRRLAALALAAATLATAAPPDARAGVTPFFAVRPNTVAVTGGQALLTVRNTTTDLITPGFQFRFVFDGPIGGVTATTSPAIVRSATLLPSDFVVAGNGTNEIVLNYVNPAAKPFGAGETVAVRVTLTLAPATEAAVDVSFFSSNGPVLPGETLAFVTFPSFPAELTGFAVE